MCEYCDPEPINNPWGRPEVGSDQWWDEVDAAYDRVKEERLFGD